MESLLEEMAGESARHLQKTDWQRMLSIGTITFQDLEAYRDSFNRLTFGGDTADLVNAIRAMHSAIINELLLDHAN